LTAHRAQRRRVVAGLAAALAGAATVGTARRRDALPPNVLFILADDLGVHDLSFLGRPDYRTPNLDRLFGAGVVLDQAYSNSPTCSPTRTALLSGRYPARFEVGLYDPLPRGRALGFPPTEPNMVRAFRAAQYRTALVGKWHLGLPPGSGPQRCGYEEFFGPLESGMDYVSHRPMGAGPQAPSMLFDGERPVDTEGYATELFTERACRLVERWRREPFFLSLHYTAPHFPWQAPGDGPTGPEIVGNHDSGSLQTYARMVQSLDAGVGRVLRSLETSGVADRTIVVFTSDNGGERFSYQWPLRGTKTELWEGGIRVPTAVRWPAGLRRRRVSTPALSMDWMPTLLSLAGLSPPEVELDGVDLSGALAGRAAAQERTLCWRTQDMAAVRRGRWKFVRDENLEYLFDLSSDPGERANRRLRDAAVHGELRDAFERWNQQMLPVPADARLPRVQSRREFESLQRR
jgi:arylsulfatase A-like enzyme